MKTVYTVNSTNCGILGVFSNKKAAYDFSIDHIVNTCSAVVHPDSTTYRKFCKNGHANIYANDSYDAERIEILDHPLRAKAL